MHGQPLKSMDIRIIPPEEKEGYMPLLLIADPSPEMVSRYLHEALLFVGYESDRAVCCAAVKVEEGRAELMNLAVGDSYRHRRTGVTDAGFFVRISRMSGCKARNSRYGLCR